MKRLAVLKAIVGVGCIATMSACGAQSGSSGPPTLSHNVEPIFASSCALGASCHGSSGAAGFVQLGPSSVLSVQQLGEQIIDVPSVTAPAMMRIAPGESTQSFLIRKVLGDFSGIMCDPASCGARMPMGEAPLPNAVIETFQRWVDEGAPVD